MSKNKSRRALIVAFILLAVIVGSYIAHNQIYKGANRKALKIKTALQKAELQITQYTIKVNK